LPNLGIFANCLKYNSPFLPPNDLHGIKSLKEFGQLAAQSLSTQQAGFWVGLIKVTTYSGLRLAVRWFDKTVQLRKATFSITINLIQQECFVTKSRPRTCDNI